MTVPDYHIPVMVNEVLEILRPSRGGIFVDCTMGGGGHTGRILEALGTSGLVIAIDQDDEAIEKSKKIYSDSRLKIVKGNFGNLEYILEREGVSNIDGCLFDLGVSSHQLDCLDRGFSFRGDAKLDMRMDQAASISAYDLVNSLSAAELERIFRDYGEERWAGRIARNIERARMNKPIETTLQLAEMIEKSVPRNRNGYNIHPATRVFMALRIAVNSELTNLEKGLRSAIELMSNQGRIVVISYHSLEDRIVKTIFKDQPSSIDPVYGTRIFDSATKRLSNLTKKPLLPTMDEVEGNPRARSAKIRAVEVFCQKGI